MKKYIVISAVIVTLAFVLSSYRHKMIYDQAKQTAIVGDAYEHMVNINHLADQKRSLTYHTMDDSKLSKYDLENVQWLKTSTEQIISQVEVVELYVTHGKIDEAKVAVNKLQTNLNDYSKYLTKVSKRVAKDGDITLEFPALAPNGSEAIATSSNKKLKRKDFFDIYLKGGDNLEGLLFLETLKGQIYSYENEILHRI